MEQKLYEILVKMGKGFTPPNSNCTTYQLIISRIWARSKAGAEQIFIDLHMDDIFEILRTTQVEPTAEELADKIVEEGTK